VSYIQKIEYFALEEYKYTNIKGLIPEEISFWKKLKAILDSELEESGGLINLLLLKDENGVPNY